MRDVYSVGVECIRARRRTITNDVTSQLVMEETIFLILLNITEYLFQYCEIMLKILLDECAFSIFRLYMLYRRKNSL